MYASKYFKDTILLDWISFLLCIFCVCGLRFIVELEAIRLLKISAAILVMSEHKHGWLDAHHSFFSFCSMCVFTPSLLELLSQANLKVSPIALKGLYYNLEI